MLFLTPNQRYQSTEGKSLPLQLPEINSSPDCTSKHPTLTHHMTHIIQRSG